MAKKASHEREHFWQDLIERQPVSGLSIAQFCKQTGVSANSFFVWKRRFRPTHRLWFMLAQGLCSYRAGQFVREPLPRLFREFVEEAHSVVGVHPVDQGSHFSRGQRVQEDVLVIVGKLSHHASGKIQGQVAEQGLLQFERKVP